MMHVKRKLHTPVRRALTLVDAIATLIILGIIIVPLASGVMALSRGGLQNYRDASIRSELVYEAERLRALPFATLVAGSTNTSVALPGGASTLAVTIATADYDADTTPDTDFLLIVLTLSDREIRFYRSNWKT